MAETSTTTVFYDGACPLCRAEIDLYRRQDQGSALRLIDVSAPDAPLPPGLDRLTAVARFDALDPAGRLLSGAEAFGAVWDRLPAWRWGAFRAMVARSGGVGICLSRLPCFEASARPRIR